MGKLNYLNVGCGNKFHKDWVNIDMVSYSSDVKRVNLLKGIPFPDNQFDVLYHSQVLEHIPKEKAPDFMKECFRVLKPGGTIRVVVPDLENIIDEYKKFLNENLQNPTAHSEANYDWIMLELLDQSVRFYSGGQMADYLKRPEIINEKYVIDRIGYVGRNIRNNYLSGTKPSLRQKFKKATFSVSFFRSAFKYAFNTVLQKLGLQSKASRIGAFRLSGEIHMWMYDKFSMRRMLTECGFVDISIKNPQESNIPDWGNYELDVKDGFVYDPTSLFVEARKKD